MKMIIDVDKVLCAVEQELGYFVKDLDEETSERIIDCIDYVLACIYMEK